MPEQMLESTIQSQTRQDSAMSLVDVMPLLIKAGQVIPPYWSRHRDWELSRFILNTDHISSAFSMFSSKFASIPLEVIPRDVSIKSHRKNAENLTALIDSGSDFGRGWTNSFIMRFVWDYLTQDNGAFAEVIGDAPMATDGNTGQRVRDTTKPRQNFYGLAWLDSQRCQRTSNPLYPVIYHDVEGSRYKLHCSRVMYTSSNPSPRLRLNGVGFCALSRCINTAQHLMDIATSEQEELGSRPKRRIIVGQQGITAGEIATAFNEADTQMDSQGLSRYSKTVVIAPKVKAGSNNRVEMNMMELSSAIKGDDKERSITLGMFLIALALNIPPRWIWPATSTGATKADAMYQHIAGMGGGIGYLIQTMQNLLGGDPLSRVLGKPIGPEYYIRFDFQDDEQDRQSAEIANKRAETWKIETEIDAIDQRRVRELMLEAGEITDEQFEAMELESGRLSDGTSILNAFMTGDRELQEMLSLSVGDVLNVPANDSQFVLDQVDNQMLDIRAILANPPRPKLFKKAQIAMAALEALRELYDTESPATSDEVESEPMEAKAVDKDELDEVFSRYHKLANMSASELERWSKTECSKKASVDRSPIQRNLRLLRKNKADWTNKDIKNANRTISFISRMKGNERGKPIGDCPSKRDISLKNWAHDPDKQ